MASTNDRVSSHETIVIILSSFYLTLLYFSQYLSSLEMESIQYLQYRFYFDILATVSFKYLILSFWSGSVILIFL